MRKRLGFSAINNRLVLWIRGTMPERMGIGAIFAQAFEPPKPLLCLRTVPCWNPEFSRSGQTAFAKASSASIASVIASVHRIPKSSSESERMVRNLSGSDWRKETEPKRPQALARFGAIPRFGQRLSVHWFQSISFSEGGCNGPAGMVPISVKEALLESFRG